MVFTATEKGWVVKEHESPCFQYGDPCCMLNHSRSYLKQMVAQVKLEATGMEAQKELRFKCYRMAVRYKHGYLGVQESKRTGFCLEKLIRETFTESDERYAGYLKLDGSKPADFN